MPRPETPVDPAAGPVAQFAYELRELRNRAGCPSYRDMQAKVYVSYSSLSRAAAGRRLPSWPVVRGFVVACGGDPDEWHERWRAAQDADSMLPDPSGIHTVVELRGAVRDILRRHDLGVVSSAMRESLATVRLLSRWPEQVELPMFERFVIACGASWDEAREWAQAWRRAVDSDAIRSSEAMVPRQSGGRLDDAPADPGAVRDYPALLTALRGLQAASGVMAAGVELSTGGRLTASRTVAILAGDRTVTGEELVLLLRAFGVRDGVDDWIDSWFRASWAALGPSLLPPRIRQFVDTIIVVLVGLSVVLAAAWL